MLANIVDEHLQQKRLQDTRDNSKFRVSDAGRCHLMRYWKREGKPPSNEPDLRTYRVFEVGHVFHTWIQNLLEESNILISKEQEVEDTHRVGHIDAIIKSDSGLILYDFKTVHSKKFHYKRKEGNNTDIHYAMQAYTYASMLNFNNIEDIRIAYISKDDLCIEETSISEFENIKELVTNDWNTLIGYWIAETEPEPNPMSWECKYCNYTDVCKYSKKEVK